MRRLLDGCPFGASRSGDEMDEREEGEGGREEDRKSVCVRERQDDLVLSMIFARRGLAPSIIKKLDGKPHIIVVQKLSRGSLDMML
jgi:hypothetical protein